MKKWQIGFTLIELIITVGLVALLASFAIAAYAGYTVKAQVATGLTLASGVTRAVEDYYAARGTMPTGTDGNAVVGLSAPETFSSNFVSSVSVSEGGNVTIVFGNKAAKSILDSKLTLYAALGSQGNVVWVCGLAQPEAGATVQKHDRLLNDVSERYLPTSCLPS